MMIIEASAALAVISFAAFVFVIGCLFCEMTERSNVMRVFAISFGVGVSSLTFSALLAIGGFATRWLP
jgi:hypothetical protein